MKIAVVENVLKLNDELAQQNRQLLKDAGVFSIDLMGSPGCGKTSLIERTLQHLRRHMKIGILVGDLTTQRDAQRMAEYTDQIVQINTGKGCHLDANQVRQGLDQLDLKNIDCLIIENVGNLICPVGFDLGQDVKVGMFSIAEGDDKAAKHPYIVHESSLLLLNKMDLLPYVNFSIPNFLEDINQLNSNVELIDISVSNRYQMHRWFEWICKQTFGRSEQNNESPVMNWCG